MITIECRQGDDIWHKSRCGIPTASNFDLILTSKGKPSKSRKKYLYRLAGERILGIPEESYQNIAMIQGTEMESEARNFYEIVNGVEVAQVGFCLVDGFGSSPDGLVGEKGGLEIKCPTLAAHVEYLLDNIFPISYFQQVQGNLLVTGREWWDFCSYYPGMKPLIIRVERDEKFLKALKIELEIFVSELEETVKK